MGFQCVGMRECGSSVREKTCRSNQSLPHASRLLLRPMNFYCCLFKKLQNSIFCILNMEPRIASWRLRNERKFILKYRVVEPSRDDEAWAFISAGQVGMQKKNTCVEGRHDCDWFEDIGHYVCFFCLHVEGESEEDNGDPEAPPPSLPEHEKEEKKKSKRKKEEDDPDEEEKKKNEDEGSSHAGNQSVKDDGEGETEGEEDESSSEGESKLDEEIEDDIFSDVEEEKEPYLDIERDSDGKSLSEDDSD